MTPDHPSRHLDHVSEGDEDDHERYHHHSAPDPLVTTTLTTDMPVEEDWHDFYQFLQALPESGLKKKKKRGATTRNRRRRMSDDTTPTTRENELTKDLKMPSRDNDPSTSYDDDWHRYYALVQSLPSSGVKKKKKHREQQPTTAVLETSLQHPNRAVDDNETLSIEKRRHKRSKKSHKHPKHKTKKESSHQRMSHRQMRKEQKLMETMVNGIVIIPKQPVPLLLPPTTTFATLDASNEDDVDNQHDPPIVDENSQPIHPESSPQSVVQLDARGGFWDRSQPTSMGSSSSTSSAKYVWKCHAPSTASAATGPDPNVETDTTATSPEPTNHSGPIGPWGPVEVVLPDRDEKPWLFRRYTDGSDENDDHEFEHDDDDDDLEIMGANHPHRYPSRYGPDRNYSSNPYHHHDRHSTKQPLVAPMEDSDSDDDNNDDGIDGMRFRDAPSPFCLDDYLSAATTTTTTQTSEVCLDQAINENGLHPHSESSSEDDPLRRIEESEHSLVPSMMATAQGDNREKSRLDTQSDDGDDHHPTDDSEEGNDGSLARHPRAVSTITTVRTVPPTYQRPSILAAKALATQPSMRSESSTDDDEEDDSTSQFDSDDISYQHYHQQMHTSLGDDDQNIVYHKRIIDRNLSMIEEHFEEEEETDEEKFLQNVLEANNDRTPQADTLVKRPDASVGTGVAPGEELEVLRLNLHPYFRASQWDSLLGALCLLCAEQQDDMSDVTAIQYALTLRDDDLVDCSEASRGLGATPLHKAAWQAPPALALQLFRMVPPESRLQCFLMTDSDGNCPLHLATANLDNHESCDIVKAIAGMTPEALEVRNSYGDTPLHLLVCSPFFHQAPPANDISDQRRWDYRREARAEGTLVSILNRAGVNMALLRNEAGATVLHLAIAHGAHERVLAQLLHMAPEAASIPDANGMLPLHYIAAFGGAPWTFVSELLYANTSAIVAQTIDGDTPLHLLLSNASKHIRHDQALLSRNTSKLAEVLIRVDGVENSPLLILNNEHLSPLHCCALFDTPPQLTQLLVDCPLAKEAAALVTPSGATALHLACASGVVAKRVDNVQALATHQACAMADKQDRTPLMVLVQNPKANKKVVKALTSVFPDAAKFPSAKGHLPLHLLLQCRPLKMSIVKLLLKEYPDAVRSVTCNGNTALHECCRYNASREDVIELLVSYNPAAIDFKNNSYQKPLNIARLNEAPKSVLAILEGTKPIKPKDKQAGPSKTHFALCSV